MSAHVDWTSLVVGVSVGAYLTLLVIGAVRLIGRMIAKRRQ